MLLCFLCFFTLRIMIFVLWMDTSYHLFSVICDLPEQSLTFLEDLYNVVYPFGQASHLCCPVSFWYVPTGHSMQKPSLQYVPVGHATEIRYFYIYFNYYCCLHLLLICLICMIYFIEFLESTSFQLTTKLLTQL